MTLTIDQAIVRFKENEERANTFVNDASNIGFYDTNETPVRHVETIKHLVNRIATKHLQVISRGAWLTSTAYVMNDIVIESGIAYLCLQDHTSGTFLTDLANLLWVIYQNTEAENVRYLCPYTGAVETNLQEKLSHTISILDYMTDEERADVILGNHNLDVTVAIQKAYDAAYFYEKSVSWVGAHINVNLTDTIIVRNGTVTEGHGATVRMGANDKTMFSCSNSGYELIFKDLILVSDASDYVNADSILRCGIYIDSCTNVKILNCRILNFTNCGIKVVNHSHLIVDGCEFYGPGSDILTPTTYFSYGINIVSSAAATVSRPLNYLRITNSTFRYFGTGIEIKSKVYPCIIDNCSFYDIKTRYGINVNSDYITDLRITKCGFKNILLKGIYIRGGVAELNAFSLLNTSLNSFDNCEDGIWVEADYYGYITDFVIGMNNFKDISNCALYIKNISNYIANSNIFKRCTYGIKAIAVYYGSIKDNILNDINNTGLQLDGNSIDNVIESNQVRYFGLNPVETYSYGILISMVHDNILKNNLVIGDNANGNDCIKTILDVIDKGFVIGNIAYGAEISAFNFSKFSAGGNFKQYEFNNFGRNTYGLPFSTLISSRNSGLREFNDDSAPASGSYDVGDVVWNVAPVAGGYRGWICVSTGSPGTWKGFGLIQA